LIQQTWDTTIALTYQEAIYNAGGFFKTHSGERISSWLAVLLSLALVHGVFSQSEKTTFVA
jgi:hypothetical protein